MNYIDADKLIAEIQRRKKQDTTIRERSILIDIETAITSLQQEQPDMDLDKLVNEEFASHSRTTEYGLVATYNRDELSRFIKRMAIVFNARNKD